MSLLAYSTNGKANKAVTASPGSVAALDQLSVEESRFQQSVAAFCENTLKGWVGVCDEKAAIDPQVIAAMFANGLMGLQVPKMYRGQGHSVFKTVLAIETISRIDPSMAVFLHVHNLLTNSIILKYGSEEQKKNFLPRLAAEEVGAFAVTEESAGSDLSNLTTQAERKGDHYVLNGKKRWITNAGEAGIFIVIARTIDAQSPRPGSQRPVSQHAGITAPGVGVRCRREVGRRPGV